MYAIIFNVLVDAIIWHWVTVVTTAEAGTEGISALLQDLGAYLFMDDTLFMSTQLERLKR